MISAVMGPVGSGKSTMMCMEILIRACNMPFCIDGVRRSKVAVIRNTYSQLETTTVATWLMWFRNLGVSSFKKASPMVYLSRFNDGRGFVELEVDLLNLKSAFYTIFIFVSTFFGLRF